MTQSPQAFFDVPLAELPAPYQGIYAPEGWQSMVKQGVTAQFLDQAETYHQRYANLPHFRAVLERAFKAAGPIPADAKVLDIGSGGGNSIFPCLEQLPQSQVIATDISDPLLAILRDAVARAPEFQGRVACVAMDATREEHYKADSFDLVLGAAILHHLLDPATAIRAAAKALKKGGKAIFLEPFEPGNAVLRLAYEDIISTHEKRWTQKLPEKAEKLLRALILDYKTRAGRDKSAPHFPHMDDKWLFTRAYFEDVALQAGFDAVKVASLHDASRNFTTQTERNLHLGAALMRDALPRWAWDILARYDNSISNDARQDLVLEGYVILSKAH
jgi:SAM-dependent methyltransferase